MHDTIFFMLQASQSSQAPSMQWGGSPITSAPPTWLPPSPTGFWPPSSLAYWRSPLQPYPGQPGEPPLPHTGSGVLADIMGISTWRAGVATLWSASIEDTAALTYDFHITHNRTNVIMSKSVLYVYLTTLHS
jgi:hypothetical protein